MASYEVELMEIAKSRSLQIGLIQLIQKSLKDCRNAIAIGQYNPATLIIVPQQISLSSLFIVHCSLFTEMTVGEWEFQ